MNNGQAFASASSFTEARAPSSAPALAFRAALTAGFAAYLAVLWMAWWVMVHDTPDRLTVSLLHHTLSLGDLHHRVVAKALVLAIALPAVLVAELGWVGWGRSSIRHVAVARTPSSMSDLVCFAAGLTPVMTLASIVLGLGVAMVSGAWIHTQLRGWLGFDLTLARLPIAVQACGLFAVYSFFDYWSHGSTTPARSGRCTATTTAPTPSVC